MARFIIQILIDADNDLSEELRKEYYSFVEDCNNELSKIKGVNNIITTFNEIEENE